MEQYTHTCIAHIAGRLIAGKGVTSMSDYYQSLEIEATGLPNDKCLRQFHYINWNCLSDPPGISYQYRYKAGYSIDIASREISFIGYARESSSYFIGAVRGDSIYLYVHKQSAHFNFRISGESIDE